MSGLLVLNNDKTVATYEASPEIEPGDASKSFPENQATTIARFAPAPRPTGAPVPRPLLLLSATQPISLLLASRVELERVAQS